MTRLAVISFLVWGPAAASPQSAPTAVSSMSRASAGVGAGAAIYDPDWALVNVQWAGAAYCCGTLGQVTPSRCANRGIENATRL